MKNTIGELYDAMGQRIAKTVTNKNVTTGDKFVTTYYVRDPQGNVLAVYEHKHGDSDNGTFTLTEQHLYGASRLGMRKRDLALNATNTSETPATYYELTNHLGNVMAVISDEASTSAEPTVVSLTDYYPFGMEMGGRKYEKDVAYGGYRYGFNGQEKETSEGTNLDYGARIYNSGFARWMSIDPQTVCYPENSPYSYCAGNPITLIDKQGETIWIYYIDENGKEQKVNYLDSEKIKQINNDFVNRTVAAFEQIKSWSDETDDRYNFKKDIDFVANNTEYYGWELSFHIKEKAEDEINTALPSGYSTTIKIELTTAMIGNVGGKNTVALPPSATLFHEFFEQWRCIIQGYNDNESDYAKWEKEYESNLTDDVKNSGRLYGAYEQGSDMYIITLLESYVAKNFYDNKEELYRDSHNGPENMGFEEYTSEGVTSVNRKEEK